MFDDIIHFRKRTVVKPAAFAWTVRWTTACTSGSAAFNDADRGRIIEVIESENGARFKFQRTFTVF